MALREAFEAFGAVDSARVIHDRETGRSRGFGFVEMPNQEEAQAALDGMEGKDLMGGPFAATKANPENAADCAQKNFSFKPGPLVQAFFCTHSSSNNPVHDVP